jgi:rubrerythrin
MKKMTEKMLEEAFAGESIVHMKYLMFQEIAEKAGWPFNQNNVRLPTS